MVYIDRLRLEFISPSKLTSQRRFELSNREACQIIEDIKQEFSEYIVHNIKDFTKADCIKISHFCPDEPDKEVTLCFELGIKDKVLLFIRNHQMPEEVKPG